MWTGNSFGIASDGYARKAKRKMPMNWKRDCALKMLILSLVLSGCSALNTSRRESNRRTQYITVCPGPHCGHTNVLTGELHHSIADRNNRIIRYYEYVDFRCPDCRCKFQKKLPDIIVPDIPPVPIP